jgi:hypothetical protein
MRLETEPDVFHAGDPHNVMRLLEMIVMQQHDWRPSPGVALKALRFAEKHAPIFSEFAEKAIIESAEPAPTAPATARVSAANLRQMVSDLRRPAVLVVENSIGDGGFVRSVAVALGDERVIEALRPHNGWLRLGHGGGYGDMPEIAAHELSAFGMLARVAVLFDSDRTSRGGPSDRQKQLDKCVEAGIVEVRLLRWRAMENYVPFRVWEAVFAARPEHVEDLRQVDVETRAYTKLKDWFKSRGCQVPKNVFVDEVTLTQNDFAELGDEVVEELRELLAMIHRIL